MEPVELTQENFDDIVQNSDTPVLIDFWAPWCGPCLMVKPVFKELAGEYEGKVIFATVNTDDQPDLSGKFSISSIPNFVLFKDGNQIDNKMGAMSKAQFKEWLSQHGA